MRFLGIFGKQDLHFVLNIISQSSSILVFCEDLFEHDLIQSLENKGIKISGLMTFEQLKNLKQVFPSFLELTHYIKEKLAERTYDFYLSTSVNPSSGDILSILIKPESVLNFKSLEDLLSSVFNENQSFNYGLPVFKQLDFIYYIYHYDKIGNYGVNFIVPNVPYFYVNGGEGVFVKVSELAKVYCFIPNSVITRTMFDYLESVMIRLRYNCQWDREQTSESIKNHLIEEAYEVWDAVQKGDPNKFKSELGDLLLQIIFHSQIQSDFKNFNFYDVLKSLVQKLIDRHPHVFNINEIHNNVEKILIDWEKNKTKENKGILVDIPKSMPSLLKLYLLYRKIKRLRMIEKFDDFINQKLKVFNPLERQILQVIHAFHSENSKNLEELINNFVDEIINDINQTQFLKIENSV